MSTTSEISGSTTVVGVVGHPVSHSLSPTIHNAAFAASGLDWVMVPMSVAPQDGSAIVAAIRTLGLAGAAVTMPHKQAVASSVDALDPAAEALNSVNTVVVRDGAQSVGYSTDGAGFVASLLANGTDLAGRRVAVVGAGAAARSVIDALGRSGCSSIQIMNRTLDSARIAAGLAPMASVVDMVEARECLSGADVIVNATSVGMGSDEIPVAGDVLHSDHTVVDLVYHPRETALLREARRVGAATIDGVGMLVHQAALQHHLWTGAAPDLDIMWDAANAALQQRR